MRILLFPSKLRKTKCRFLPRCHEKSYYNYAKSQYVKSSTFSEVYIGGGSPSVLSELQIKGLLNFCKENFNISKDAMTKFTACTNNLNSKKIKLLSEEKVSQIDVGIQTFNEEMRKTLLLRDSGKDAILKMKEAKKNDIGVSIDLLYNLPGQTIEQWEKDLQTGNRNRCRKRGLLPLRVI